MWIRLVAIVPCALLSVGLPQPQDSKVVEVLIEMKLTVSDLQIIEGRYMIDGMHTDVGESYTLDVEAGYVMQEGQKVCGGNSARILRKVYVEAEDNWELDYRFRTDDAIVLTTPPRVTENLAPDLLQPENWSACLTPSLFGSWDRFDPSLQADESEIQLFDISAYLIPGFDAGLAITQLLGLDLDPIVKGLRSAKLTCHRRKPILQGGKEYVRIGLKGRNTLSIPLGDTLSSLVLAIPFLPTNPVELSVEFEIETVGEALYSESNLQLVKLELMNDVHWSMVFRLPMKLGGFPISAGGKAQGELSYKVNVRLKDGSEEKP